MASQFSPLRTYSGFFTAQTGSLPAKISRRGERRRSRSTTDGGKVAHPWRTTTQELRLVALGGMMLTCLILNVNAQGLAKQRTESWEYQLWRRATNAAKAGIQRGDVIVAFGDQIQRLTESGIIGYVLQERSEAKALPIVCGMASRLFQLSLESSQNFL